MDFPKNFSQGISHMGYRAFVLGLDRCPYSPGDSANSWRHGYNQAQQDLEKGNRVIVDNPRNVVFGYR